jgi:CheY-like chemotaxis protein
VLEDNGYATVSARDGNEALQRLEEGLPDLVTLDITMPEKSGVGVYRKIKETDEYKGIPVIIITGVSDDFKQFISTRRQVPPPEGYLSKPVEPGQLAGMVEELLA